MKSKCLVIAVSIALTAMFGTGSALGALDAYLKVAGIDGESNQAMFVGWSDLLGYNISVQNDGWSSSGGGGAGRATFSPMFVQKYVDKASPKLFGAVLTGTHFPTATIDVRHAGTTSTRFALWEFEDVVISAYSTGQFTEAAVESLALDYRRIRYTYWPQQPDGSAGTPVVFGYDRQTNTTWLSGGSLADFELITHFTAAAIPEPSALALLGCGLSALVLCRRRRYRATSTASELPEMRVPPCASS